eukprot:TRINITY_DN3427_c0_g1_i3.p1 TRINITY_DN3427_c0_g1~~TRINITY_DN3427_c0_g1_i3.p1  ORF type:complete len:339 (+),score=115.33 TRINITY_DN3427_c0_g1_i3:455-1471(+)
MEDVGGYIGLMQLEEEEQKGESSGDVKGKGGKEGKPKRTLNGWHDGKNEMEKEDVEESVAVEAALKNRVGYGDESGVKSSPVSYLKNSVDLNLYTNKHGRINREKDERREPLHVIRVTKTKWMTFEEVIRIGARKCWLGDAEFDESQTIKAFDGATGQQLTELDQIVTGMDIVLVRGRQTFNGDRHLDEQRRKSGFRECQKCGSVFCKQEEQQQDNCVFHPQKLMVVKTTVSVHEEIERKVDGQKVTNTQVEEVVQEQFPCCSGDKDSPGCSKERHKGGLLVPFVTDRQQAEEKVEAKRKRRREKEAAKRAKEEAERERKEGGRERERGRERGREEEC